MSRRVGLGRFSKIRMASSTHERINARVRVGFPSSTALPVRMAPFGANASTGISREDKSVKLVVGTLRLKDVITRI